MGLADQPAIHAGSAQVVAHGLLAHAQGKAVELGAMRGSIAPGIGRHARRAAYGRLHIGTGETHPARGNGVDMRGVQCRMTGAGKIVEAQLVEHDEKDVFGRHDRSFAFIEPNAQRRVREARLCNQDLCSGKGAFIAICICPSSLGAPPIGWRHGTEQAPYPDPTRHHRQGAR